MNIYIGEPIVISDMQGPCPDGFHVPLSSEWTAIYNAGVSLGAWTSSNGTNFSTYLKMPYSGYRNYNRTIDSVGENGMYYSSSPDYNRLFIRADSIYPEDTLTKSFGASIRAFRDSPVAPDSTWTELYTNGIYHNSTLGLISVKNGSSWITIADKNLGATTVYNYGDTLTDANCGNVFQWGNNYAFPGTKSSDSISSTATRVDASSYGPGNYYNSSKWISYNGDWSSVTNNNLRGGTSQGTSTKGVEAKNIYIGEYGWKPGANTVAYYPLTSTTTVNDMSGNELNLTNNGNVSFGTNYGVNCANFTGNGVLRNSTLTTQYIGQTFTISEWVLRHGSEFVIGTFNNSGTKRSIGIVFQDTSINFTFGTGSYWSDNRYNYNSLADQWYHIVLTHDDSGALVGYLNGNQVITGTVTISEGTSNFGIGASVFKDSEIYYSNGAASEIILENKAWTAEEVSDYYNQTKSNYGL